MAYFKDDVDRLFACFKCGVSPPASATKEKRINERKLSRSKRGSPVVDEKEMPTCSRPLEDNSSMEGQKNCSSSSTAIKFRSGELISPIIFYGSARGAPVKRPSRILRLLHEIHVDLREEDALISREGLWATFPRQEEAFQFARTHRNSNVFSYQDHLTGKRRFLVSTYEEFWKRYKCMDSKVRHHYEVIEEGHPCHLYFDLEFDKRLNISRNADEMVDILTSVTLTALTEKYSIEANHEFVVELDSSTEEKFSRHLIIRLPKTAFKDNLHAGAFVSEICSRIESMRGSYPQVNKLYIKKDSSNSNSADHLFLDAAVYSRNRCFRLAFSSKAGKCSFLLPTGRFKCKSLSEQQVFLESLICRMDEDCEKMLICKLDLDCIKALSFDTEVHEKHTKFLWKVNSSVHTSDEANINYATGRSPFPLLDAFIESMTSIRSISGKIQSWYWFSAYGLIVYNISRNRYCERIGREHKSNHVMYVVDYQRAVYYQKCHDPDCRGYRSPFRALPCDVLPESSSRPNLAQMENYKAGIYNSMGATDNAHMLIDGDTDISWWNKATEFTEFIENTRNWSEFGVLDEAILDEDCAWYTE